MAVGNPFTTLPAVVERSNSSSVGAIMRKRPSVDWQSTAEKAKKQAAEAKKFLALRTGAKFQEDVTATGAAVVVSHVATPYLEKWLEPKPGDEGVLGGRSNLLLAAGAVGGAWFMQKDERWVDGLLGAAAFQVGVYSARSRKPVPGTMTVQLPPGVTPTMRPEKNTIPGVSGLADRMERRQDRRQALLQGLAEEGIGDTMTLGALIDDAIEGVEDDGVGAGPLLLAPAALQALRGWLASITPAQAQQATGTTAAQAVVQGLGYDELGAVEARDVLTAESVSGREERKARRDKRRRERLAKQNAPKQIAKTQVAVEKQSAQLDAIMNAVQKLASGQATLAAKVAAMEQMTPGAPVADEGELIVEPI